MGTTTSTSELPPNALPRNESPASEAPASKVQPISSVGNTMKYSKNMAAKSLSTLASSYKFVWHAWLGTAVSSQKAATSFAKGMAKKGEETEDRARKQLKERARDVRSASRRMRDEALSRIDALEGRIGRGMSRSLHFVGVPTRGDVDRLALLMADMSESIEELAALEQQRQEQHTRAKRPSASS